MNASARSNGFHAFCRRFMPFMLRRCPADNLHWRWDQWCICCNGTNGMGPLVRVNGMWLDGNLRPVNVPWWRERVPK